MKVRDAIDFSKLLGFDALGDETACAVDFQDETIDAKLGAKVGKPELAPVTLAEANIKPAS